MDPVFATLWIGSAIAGLIIAAVKTAESRRWYREWQKRQERQDGTR